MKKVLLIALGVLLLIAVYNMFTPAPSAEPDHVSLGQLMDTIRAQPHQVKWLRIRDTSWRGQWADGRRFRTNGPKLDGALLKELAGIPLELDDTDDFTALLIGTWLPLLLLLGLFFWFMRRVSKAQRSGLGARVVQLEAELALLKSQSSRIYP